MSDPQAKADLGGNFKLYSQPASGALSQYETYNFILAIPLRERLSKQN